MKNKEIEQAIEYLNNASVTQPIRIRVEEIEINRIVLSFEEDSYSWAERIYKEFLFDKGQVISMKLYTIKK